MLFVWIIIGLIVIIALYYLLTYNSLVGQRNNVDNAWSQIDVQLKRRHDLIPNLVETVKGYARYERTTLEAVTNARNLAVKAVGQDVAARAEAESQLSGALSRLLAVAEAYPDLKASQNYLSLQEELTATENRIAFARQYYNDSVLHYNNQTQMFPSSAVANAAGFKPRSFFEVPLAEEREVPKVTFE
jgi:LemA protein